MLVSQPNQLNVTLNQYVYSSTNGVQRIAVGFAACMSANIVSIAACTTGTISVYDQDQTMFGVP
jgi:hypothetical protein